jgi:hypothetical protein
LDGSLNEYKCKCLDAFDSLGKVSIVHIPSEQNEKANALAQQAFGYNVQCGLFETKTGSMLQAVLVVPGGESESAEAFGQDD